MPSPFKNITKLLKGLGYVVLKHLDKRRRKADRIDESEKHSAEVKRFQLNEKDTNGLSSSDTAQD